jgi:hypothetical protein
VPLDVSDDVRRNRRSTRAARRWARASSRATQRLMRRCGEPPASELTLSCSRVKSSPVERSGQVAQFDSSGASAVRADPRRTLSRDVRRSGRMWLSRADSVGRCQVGSAIGWVCKPEVTGSIPVRSMHYLQISTFCCPNGRIRGRTACPRLRLVPAKPACLRKFPHA